MAECYWSVTIGGIAIVCYVIPSEVPVILLIYVGGHKAATAIISNRKISFVWNSQFIRSVFPILNFRKIGPIVQAVRDDITIQIASEIQKPSFYKRIIFCKCSGLRCTNALPNLRFPVSNSIVTDFFLLSIVSNHLFLITITFSMKEFSMQRANTVPCKCNL